MHEYGLAEEKTSARRDRETEYFARDSRIAKSKETYSQSGSFYFLSPLLIFYANENALSESLR